jgi:hypothetical protein
VFRVDDMNLELLSGEHAHPKNELPRLLTKSNVREQAAGRSRPR